MKNTFFITFYGNKLYILFGSSLIIWNEKFNLMKQNKLTERKIMEISEKYISNCICKGITTVSSINTGSKV